MLENKKIIVGITACSPATESIKLIEELKKLGADVHVVLTENAQNFVTLLMVQRSVNHPIQMKAFESPKTWDKTHKSLTKDADLMIIAPLSANTLGKAANGIADNLLSTTIMSMRGPKVFAMHINDMMYQSPSVKRNINLLKEDGIIFVDNKNEEHPSRFPSIEQIIDTVSQVIQNNGV